MKIEEFYCVNYPFLSRKLSVDIEFSLRVGSTNSELKEKVKNTTSVVPYCLVAIEQSSGRGTRGRQWKSEKGGIYMSLSFPIEEIVCNKVLIPLAVSTGVCEALQSCGVRALLKWPNDIFVNGGKAGGILCELIHNADGKKIVIIGIGLNQKSRLEKTTNGWKITGIETDSFDMNIPENRTRLLDELIVQVLSALQYDDERVVNGWKKKDLFRNLPLVLETEDEEVHGVSRGVDGLGRILLETPLGTRIFSSGSIKNDNVIN